MENNKNISKENKQSKNNTYTALVPINNRLKNYALNFIIDNINPQDLLYGYNSIVVNTHITIAVKLSHPRYDLAYKLKHFGPIKIELGNLDVFTDRKFYQLYPDTESLCSPTDTKGLCSPTDTKGLCYATDTNRLNYPCLHNSDCLDFSLNHITLNNNLKLVPFYYHNEINTTRNWDALIIRVHDIEGKLTQLNNFLLNEYGKCSGDRNAYVKTNRDNKSSGDKNNSGNKCDRDVKTNRDKNAYVKTNRGDKNTDKIIFDIEHCINKDIESRFIDINNKDRCIGRINVNNKNKSTYEPHITLAYLKHGAAKKYIDYFATKFSHMQYIIDHIVISRHKNGSEQFIYSLL